MLGVPSASFKSAEQAAVTTHFLSCSSPSLLAVMPTGGGKTITFALPAFTEQGTSAITLVLVPFRGLAVSHLANLERYKVSSVYYQGETELAKLLPQQPNIIIMTYDTFVGAIAKHDLRGINVRRVVIDEAHTIHTDASWRVVMEVVGPSVVKLGRPFLLLTGTLPVHSESSLLRQFYPSPVAIVRMNTARPNLRYLINLYEEESASVAALVTAIGEELKSSVPSHASKWMVFVSDIPGVSRLKEQLETACPILGRISHYHGRMQPAESDPELGDWLAGTTVSPHPLVLILTNLFL
jgi:superfamily II DNA helicase RecQ